MSDSGEDDTHMCVRCRQTFVGIDNYIAHRKVKCRRLEVTGPRPPDIMTDSAHCSLTSSAAENRGTEVVAKITDRQVWNVERNECQDIPKEDSSLEDILRQAHLLELTRKDGVIGQFLSADDKDSCLKADDFFSSLELQSSKSIPSFHDMSSTNRLHQTGVMTRSRVKKSKEISINKPIITSCIYEENDDLETNVLVGKDVVMAEKIQQDAKDANTKQEITDTKLDSTNLPLIDTIFDTEVHHEVVVSSEKTLNVNSESSTEDSDDEDDDYDDDSSGRIPTGGKWKPEGRYWENSPQNYWGTDIPPSTHTGGKWKPPPPSPASSESLKQSEENLHTLQVYPEESPQEAPPPGHTRGKWLPARTDPVAPQLRKSGGRIQYWCGPCNRRLSSRGLYEKHLQSDLHQKRICQERQLDEDLRLDSGREDGKRVVKRTNAYINSSLWTKAKTKRLKQASVTPSADKSGESSPKRRRKGRISITCSVCRCKVWRDLMGKHLVSHFHWRRALSAPEKSTQLVTKYMYSIVLQAPFQCGLCRFYCNTFSSFMQHWTSEMHENKDSQVSGIYWCTFCRYASDTTSAMYKHLLSDNHTEVVAVINRSVPIVIQKRKMIRCDVCDKTFRYNFQLRLHAKQTTHAQTTSSSTDKYQERVICNRCGQTLYSRKSLQRHLMSKHKNEKHEGRFFCSTCDLQFDTLDEAKEHRSTQNHRYATQKRNGKEKYLQKICPHCFGTYPDVGELKTHLRSEHPEQRYRCIKCGDNFTLKQELAHHVRFNKCQGMMKNKSPVTDVSTLQTPAASSSSASGIAESSSSSQCSQCSKCEFASSSQAELLFHTALHSDPIIADENPNGNDNKVSYKYLCPSCPKVFPKHALKKHMFIHTGERPYACKVCGIGFSRNDVMARHMLTIHGVNITMRYKKSKTADQVGREKNNLCAQCGATFYDKNTLQQHMKIHLGKTVKCMEPGCVFTCRSNGELQLHLKTHSEEKPFQCSHCEYSSKTKAHLVRHWSVHMEIKSHRCPHCDFSCRSATHLKRHLRLHTGARPYHCPHCSYTCNLLENLRKHVLSTKKHPGKSLYSCKVHDCRFTTNLSKDYRVHLVTAHGQTAAAASSYVAGLYHGVEDPKYVDAPIVVTRKTKRRKKEPKLQAVGNGRNAENHREKQNLSPTLASVSISSARTSTEPEAVPTTSNVNKPDEILRSIIVSDPSEDIIYIQLPPDDTLDGYDSEVPLFSPGDVFLTNSEITQRTLLFENLPCRTAPAGETSSAVMLPLESDDIVAEPSANLIVIDENVNRQ